MATPLAHETPRRADVSGARDDSGRFVLNLSGRLDAETTGAAWREAMRLTGGVRSGDLLVDAAGLEYCDGAGASLLLALRDQQQRGGGRFALEGLRDESRQLLELFEAGEAAPPEDAGAHPEGWVAQLGRSTLQLVSELRTLTVFVGELTVMLLQVARRPSLVRSKDVFLVAERAGIGAIPIIALVGFLLGLILAFQSAIPMQKFGAQVFVADLLGISLLRELGPLMAAILLAARSGSAFAAELGTMKVNEEIDALTTMGLEPVRFLVVPRVVAAVIVVPVLAMIMNVAGLLGGAVVFQSLGFPLVTYVNRIVAAAGPVDFLGGIFKAMVFGIVVAGIGCLRGLQAGSGAGAVGEATTSSVVSGIVMIAIIDGAFAVIFFVVGI